MKKIFLAIMLSCVSFFSFAQKARVYATVFDEDNNPVARGIFKSAADSGIIIVVDDMEIFVNATEITVLKIEKDPSTSEFLKLGTAAATDVVSYLVNKPKKEKDTVPADSIISTAGKISTETKDALLQRINSLVENLMSGKNNLATMNINNSTEKFLSKLRLLQEYSMDKEIVAWNEYAQNQQPANAINEPQQEQMQQDTATAGQTLSTDQPILSSAPVKPPVAVPAAPKTVTLGKGFLFVKPTQPVIPVIAIPAKEIKSPIENKNVVVEPASPKQATMVAPKVKPAIVNTNNINTAPAKPIATVPAKPVTPVPAAKSPTIIPAVKTPQQSQPKPKAESAKKTGVHF